MNKITVTAFQWAPPFAHGLVRDLRVRWALEEAGLSYDIELIDANERHSAANRAKHPFGLVPAFEVNGFQLFESGAILHQIATESDVLMPTDQDGRTNTLVWMFAALNTVEPPLQNLFQIDVLYGDEEWAKQRRPAVLETVKARLGALEAWLDDREYLIGPFTAADILMTAVLRWIRHTDLLTEFPVLDAYAKRCEARPAFQKALCGQADDFARHAPLAA